MLKKFVLKMLRKLLMTPSWAAAREQVRNRLLDDIHRILKRFVLRMLRKLLVMPSWAAAWAQVRNQLKVIDQIMLVRQCGSLRFYTYRFSSVARALFNACLLAIRGRFIVDDFRYRPAGVGTWIKPLKETSLGSVARAPLGSSFIWPLKDTT